MVDYFQTATGQLKSMDVIIVEKKNKYEALIQEASKVFLIKKFQEASKLYNNALVIAKELRMGQMMICIIKYMVAQCLLHSNKLDDLAEAVMLLQTLDKALKDRLPASYCLLAQAHCKLFRFDQALDVIREADNLYKRNPLLEKFYIPGTNIIITQGPNEGTWLKVKEECLTYHRADAICPLPECNNITKPYVIPSKQIFISDPAFTGMVRVHCNNKKSSCSLSYHPNCWKFIKDRMYPAEKVSDKDILGKVCFTPNCMNDDVHCVVSSIEIVGPNGETKAHIKESTSVAWPVNKNATKGAIKKVKVHVSKKTESPTTPKQLSTVTPKQETHTTKQLSRLDGFDEDQILTIKYNTPDVDFSSDLPNIACEKYFLLSYFYESIQNNLVRVCDAYSMFTDISESLQLKDLDILTFLLETNKFELLDSSYNTIYPPIQVEENTTNKVDLSKQKLNTSNIKSENTQNQTEDDDSYYAELMCEDDDCEYSEIAEKLSKKNYMDNNNKDSFPNGHIDDDTKTNYATNACSTNFNCEAAGGDAPPYLKYNLHDEKVNKPFTPPEVDSRASVPYSNGSEKRGTDNRKLKEYINQMESQMKKMEEDSCRLKKELKEKDLQIESFKKTQEAFVEKMELCEKLYTTMSDFQKKYENIREENLQIKEELISSINEKTKLEEKLLELDNPEFRRQELLKAFKEEYQILQDHINLDWEKKTGKLEQSLKNEIEIKMTLLKKSLNNEYTGHRNMLNGYIDQCTMVLEIISKVNIWMEKTINTRQFIDSSEWINRLNLLQRAVSDHQDEYNKLLMELQSECTERFEQTDINMSLPTIPKPPQPNIGDLIQSALNTYYKGQCQIVQSLVKTHPLPVYPTPAPNYLQYPQVQYHHQYPTTGYPAAASTAPMQYQLPGQLPTRLPFFLQQQQSAQESFQFMQKQQQQSSPQKTTVSITENIEQGEDNESVTSNNENLSIKLEPVEVNKSDIKEEQKDNEKVKEVKNKRNSVANTIVENQTSPNNIMEKIEKMRKALKVIALNVEEKTKPECTSDIQKKSKPQSTSDNEKTLTDVKKELSDDCVGNSADENIQSDALQVASICGSSVSDVASIKDENIRSKKKVGMETLLKMMLKKYPGSLETDIIEIIDEIRKKHNNSLSGMSVSEIYKESEEYFLNCQRLHMLRYNINDGSKSTFTETPSKSSDLSHQYLPKETISPASSCVSLSRSDMPTTPKKTWNAMPQEETKWDPQGDIECSICMGTVSRSKCFTLKCRHSFHSQCVKTWLKSDRSCPNCRIAVTDDDEFPPLP